MPQEKRGNSMQSVDRVDPKTFPHTLSNTTEFLYTFHKAHKSPEMFKRTNQRWFPRRRLIRLRSVKTLMSEDTGAEVDADHRAQLLISHSL